MLAIEMVCALAPLVGATSDVQPTDPNSKQSGKERRSAGSEQLTVSTQS